MSSSHEKLRTFGSDLFFYNPLCTYPLESRCEMLREIGLDAAYLTLWNEVAWTELTRFDEVTRNTGLGIAAVWMSLDPGDAASLDKVRRAVEHIPAGGILELALRSDVAVSSSEGDRVAANFLHAALEILQAKAIRLALYHHVFWWMEQVSDAVRLCRAVQNPSLGICLSTYHWFVVDYLKHEKFDFRATLIEMQPFLMQVNFGGACPETDPKRAEACPYKTRPFTEGALDHFLIYALLRESGYNGAIGFNGYSVQGDPYFHLETSLKAFRDIEARWMRHPAWAKVPPPM